MGEVYTKPPIREWPGRGDPATRRLRFPIPQAIETLGDTDADKPQKMFGRQTSRDTSASNPGS